MADTNKIVEQLSGLSVLEIAGLVKQLEEKWGVSAAAPVAVAAGPTAGGPAGAASRRARAGDRRTRGPLRCKALRPAGGPSGPQTYYSLGTLLQLVHPGFRGLSGAWLSGRDP